MDPNESATHKAIEAVWRIESARLIGGLVRIVRDVALAEDLAQEALVVALERWPADGIPERPGAWLMATARNRAIDELRRRQMLERKHIGLRPRSPRAMRARAPPPRPTGPASSRSTTRWPSSRDRPWSS